MAVQEEHCHQNESSPNKRSKLTILALAHQMMQGVVFEEWWEVWAMDGKWHASFGRIDVRRLPLHSALVHGLLHVLQ